MAKNISNRYKPGWQQVRKPLPPVLKRDRTPPGQDRNSKKGPSRSPKSGR
ncbi:MAG: hypothetical protein MUP28_03195 [Candidatus Aminicenantes bacterium]|nr:hypothetical protein [Candidatus Aminicenantes bacterium]